MPEKSHQGHDKDKTLVSRAARNEDFVLEKSIFSNIFEKDIRRVFIYKKAERLAKALHLIAPAFASSLSLRNRIDATAIGLVDAAILPPAAAKEALSRELLGLSSVLSIARAGELLSPMNADLIAREAQQLLQEVAAYEEPRLFLEDAPSLTDIAKRAVSSQQSAVSRNSKPKEARISKGHASDPNLKDRRDAILSVIRSKGKVYIKDISVVVRGISEKTIQRELALMLKAGIVRKEGERRWTSYSLAPR